MKGVLARKREFSQWERGRKTKEGEKRQQEQKKERKIYKFFFL